MRDRWESNEAAIGVWITSPGVVATQMLTGSRFDYACVDLQHGVIDYQEMVPLLQAIELGPATPISRVPWNEPGIIGKSLDAGSMGVIVPMVNTRAEAEAAVFAGRYPPDGGRSHGPVRAAIAHGAQYWSEANAEISVIVMIETVEALNNVDEILSTPGVDACYVGPADLSRSLGLPPGNNDDDAAFTDALAAIVVSCRRHGVVPGCHTSAELTAKRLEMGFRMITITSDLVALGRGLTAEFVLADDPAGEGGDGKMY